MAQTTLEALLTLAEQHTGLSDWGAEDFYDPLQRFLHALAEEAHLTPIGEQFFQQECVRLLSNRLKLQAELTAHPEICQRPIERPLIVTGLFRSGTSFLHNLLSQDPRARWLHLAEALYPVPAPTADTWVNDPRLEQVTQLVNFQNGLAPNFVQAHHIAAHKPAECSRLFEHAFIGHLFDFRANVPSYSAWLQHQPLEAAYRYYQQQLQYLSWHWSGSHWLLKAPAHIYALDALLTVFPSACIVYLQRDPREVLPSCCSLTALGRSRFSHHVDEPAIGNYWLQRLAQTNQRIKSVRGKLPAQQIYDVAYRDLLHQPQQVVQDIYTYFGYSWSDDLALKLAQWSSQNRQHQHGVHRYSLEQFGLTASQIERKFANA